MRSVYDPVIATAPERKILIFFPGAGFLRLVPHQTDPLTPPSVTVPGKIYPFDSVTHSSMNRFILVSALAALIILTGQAASAQASVTASIGDAVQLSGMAPGADVVYLFLTGPNLPSNGVRLEDISAPVVTGIPSSFTQAAVSGDQWEYTWYTNTRGGTLDAGIYTIYVTTTPVGRNNLGNAVYSTIVVTLTRPSLVVGETGYLQVHSLPSGVEIRVDGVMQGTTPMELTGIPVGSHQIEIRAEGYQPFLETVTISAGMTTGVDAILLEAHNTTALPVDTTVVPQSPPSTTPTRAPLPPATIPIALGAAAMIGRRRR
jgi:hypothetical protein